MDPIKISAEQAESYREAFNIFDKNGDGTISASELGSVMKSIGQKASKKEIKSMIKEVDVNCNGSVEYDEFCQMMVLKMQHNDQETEIRDAFR